MAHMELRNVMQVNGQKHIVRAGQHRATLDSEPDSREHREHIEPWLSALFQAEHLNVLWIGDQLRRIDWAGIARTWQGGDSPGVRE